MGWQKPEQTPIIQRRFAQVLIAAIPVARPSVVLYELQVLGEACKRLSAEFCESHPEIAWSGVAGLRDVVVHEYDHISFDVI